MASSDYLPIGADPDLQAARQRAINQATAPDIQPDPPEHPAVTYAKTLLSPMGPYGPAPRGLTGLDTSQIDYGTPPTFRNYNFDPLTPEEVASRQSTVDASPLGWIGQQLAKVGETRIGPLAGITDTTFGDIGALIAPPTQTQGDNPLYALGPEGNFAGNIGEALGPAARMVGNKVLGGAQDVLQGRLPEFVTQAAGEGRADLGLGGSERQVAAETSQIEGGLTSRIGGKGSLGVPEEGAGPMGAQNVARQALADETAAKTPLIQRQIDSLRQEGATQAEIDDFMKTMAPKVETKPALITSEGATVSPSNLTRALQTAAGAEGTPLSQHPVFADYGVGGANGPTQAARHGGDIGTATRAVMAGDPAALDVLGPELSQQLIQNKIADIVRKTGASEDAVRIGLGETYRNIGAGVNAATPEEVAQVGKNTQAVVDALTGGDVVVQRSRPGIYDQFSKAGDIVVGDIRPQPRFSFQSGGSGRWEVWDNATGALKGIFRTVEDAQGRVEQLTVNPNAPAQEFPFAAAPRNEIAAGSERGALTSGESTPIDFGPEPPATPPGGTPPVSPPTGTGGAMLPDAPLPIAPMGRNPVKALALAMLDLVTDLPRVAYLVGHLPLLRQGLPMMADAFVRGNPQEIALALGRTLRSYVISDARAAEVVNQFRGVLSDAGFSGDSLRKLVSDVHGPMSAREDYTLNSFLANLPVLKQLNRAFPTMMNSLRVGMALDRVRMAEAAGQKVDFNLIADQVAHISGKGDLPGTPGGKFQEIMSRMFFGPKLLTAPWQTATDTIKSLTSIGSDVLSRKPVQANDIAQVRAVAAYVLTGATVMQFMQNAGWQAETNTSSRDWGRVIDPNTGERVDLWGAFGPDARLVMQTLTWLNETQLGIGTPVRPQKYGATDIIDMLQDYFRNKLGPGLPAVTANVLTGKTGAGTPFSLHDELAKAGQDPGGYAAANAPRPLGLEAFGQSNPSTAGRNALLVEAGAGVVTTPHRDTYDGLGTAEGQSNYRSGSILDTYAKMVEASKASGQPWHGGDPIMPAPSSTIGSGRTELKLDPKTAGRFAQAIGDARDRALGPLVNSPEFQNAGPTRQQQMFDEARIKADNTATRIFMKNEVIAATDPKAIAAEAVTGFVAQGSSLHDRAYWVATLNRAGKLTPEVAKAIDDYENQLASAEKRAPITVQEYTRYAPLAHEYLAHVPFGTDTHPIGTPADWTVVAQANDAKNARVDVLIRGGTNPSVANVKAQQEILQTLSMVQRNLFLNGTQLENPQRVLLAKKYPTLSRFVGSAAKYTRENEASYQNFP